MIIRKSKMKRAKQTLGFIRGYIASNDEAPTIAEIGTFLGFSSPASVYAVLVAMEKFGMVERTRNWRGITLK